MAPAKNSNIQLLAVLADPDDEDEHEYRFLVDGTHVKYVTVAPGGVLPKDNRTFAPEVLAGLPPFPPGDWNEGHADQRDGAPVFVRTEKNTLAGVTTLWHPTLIDHLSLRPPTARLRQNIHVTSHPLFDPHPVIAKFTEFPWQTPRLEAETVAYQWLEGSGVAAPRFLGHLTEEGRVIGFVLEYIGDGARTAGPGDLDACRSVLGKLHALGVRHGDVNRHNFLVRGDGTAVLMDFETATRDVDADELEVEMERLVEALQDPSLRGAVRPVAATSDVPGATLGSQSDA